jgi:adenine phosphoribosyltransferase
MPKNFQLDEAIRKIPDFPKPGILYYDITSILTNPKAFAFCLSALEKRCKALKVDALAAIESRGFLFAAPLAHSLKLPLILVRKKGKLPGKTVSRAYNLEYGKAEIEIHVDDIPVGGRVAVIDDLIATGGTVKAACDLLRENGAQPAAVLGVIGLPFLNYQQTLGDLPAEALIEYFGE